MSMKNWSTTAASNATVDSISFAEGQAPSSLNDSARALMADVRYELATQDTIASATTTDLGSKDAGSLTISGTTTITGFGTVSAGIRKLVTHSGALTLTHNGTSLILPGAADITTATGDSYIAESLGSGNWKVHAYQRASGTPVKYLSSSFTGTLTGCSTSPTGTVYYVKNGDSVTLDSSGTSFTGTSNATTKTITGMPTAIRPASVKLQTVIVSDNGGSNVLGECFWDSTGVLAFYTSLSAAGWTSSGTANISRFQLSYTVN